MKKLPQNFFRSSEKSKCPLNTQSLHKGKMFGMTIRWETK